MGLCFELSIGSRNIDLKTFKVKLKIFGVGGNCPRTADIRITILCNIIALIGALASIGTYVQLLDWGVDRNYLLVYFAITFCSISTIFLNFIGWFIEARVLFVLLLNLTAWNALIFFGKSFNGYYFFFVALVFSVIAFRRKHLVLRWISIVISLFGLPVSDYLTRRGIVPITGFDSSQGPITILFFDTALASAFIVLMLVIETSMSEKYESDLNELNLGLEGVVERRTRQLKESREKALAASQAKSQFIGNVSHELRTPLTSILGFVELIRDPQSTDVEKIEYLEIITNNANQLLNSVNEILDLSMIESQKLQIENTVFRLKNVIDEIVTATSKQVSQKKLTLSVGVSKLVPEEVQSDVHRLRQILMNLVGNAIKFTNRGSIELIIDRVQQSNGQPALQFDVVDTGIGISELEKIEIFEPFRQGDNSDVRRYPGTGLGLSVSKELAELLGGDLSLQSSVLGRGSVFRLLIPIEVQAERGGHVEILDSSSPKLPLKSLLQKRILLVDDSKDTQVLVTQILERYGAIVEVADTGEDALKKISESSEFNIVLMDLQMPVLDGYETTRILRDRGYTVPIVAFTAHAMKDERIRSESAGFTCYLSKPFSAQDMLSKLLEYAV